MSDGRILVVDDDPLLRNSVAMVLEDEGYTVEHAVDGADALRKVAAQRPDVILLDVMMPRMSGNQVLKVLQSDALTSDIPVVVMTAISGLANPGSAVSSGYDLVEKPFDVNDLLNKIALAMYRRGGEGPGSDQPERGDHQG